MSPQDLLRQCADAISPDGNNSITLVHPPGTGRFPFRGPGVELLSYVEGRGRVYAVDIEVVLRWVAKCIASERAAWTARYEAGS